MPGYDADYFMRGQELGISGYTDYRWLPNLTVPMAQRIVEHCRIEETHSILDFGCARGYLVRALRILRLNAYGVDVSQWAIDNCDEEVKYYLGRCEAADRINSADPIKSGFNWIIAKDVLEHIPYVSYTITKLMSAATSGLFVVVPLSQHDKGKYVVEDYERDRTHVQRWTLNSWAEFFIRPGWSVEVSYRVPGIKDNYASHEKGNGFITCRRII